VLKVWVKVCPLAIGDDAKELSSALTVWSVESSNFQVTVVPTGTVRLPGMNMKFMISTVDPPPADPEPLDADAVAVAGGAPPPPESDPQAATVVRAASTAMIPTSRRRGRTRASAVLDMPDPSCGRGATR
jgi:hypothetical protein